MKRKMMNPDVSRSGLGETSHRSSEVMGNDPILEAKHKIFLSHSGAEKEFVEHLCKALEDRFYYPFFDRRHECLPKGERFLELIDKAAKQCEMLIVVVSDEYFMSKWPMIELSAFVKVLYESKSSTNGLKILPLFYGLSVDDLRDATRQKKWFRKWEILAKADSRNEIIVSDWKHAFEVLMSFNGLPYDKNLKEIVAYEEKIVSHVCKSIHPVKQWDDSHVLGKSNILKVIGEKIEEIGISRQYKVKVLGIYGVGGIGKTTTCKILGNELLSKYKGRVCHIELPIVPSSVSKEFFQKVLQDLTRKNVDAIQHLDEGQCEELLWESLFRQKTFLTIDNITDSHQSIELAKRFLELPYHKESLVVLTARSRSVFELLGVDGDACLEMPDLREVDALRLFLQYATFDQQFSEDEKKDDIMMCIKTCYFSKGDGRGYHYHPLALKSLGLQLGLFGEKPSDWVRLLRTFNYVPGRNPVFDILRSSFDSLSPKDQTLFMDVGLFYMWDGDSTNFVIEWLCAAHKQDEEEITHRLEVLKRKGLLQDVDLRSNKVTMHDLYLQFTKLEAKGSFTDSTNLGRRRWVYVENDDLTELECSPAGGCWPNLIRLTIKHLCWSLDMQGRLVHQIGSLEGIKWYYFSNVEVLQLLGVVWEQGALNLKGLVCLRILELVDVRYIDGIEGLEKLEQLTHFTWYPSCSSHGACARIVGQLPSSLKLLKISGDDVVLGSDLLARCHNLVKLSLDWVEAGSLDLSNCWSLESVSLSEIRKLQTLSGPAARRSSSLQSLKVWDCEDLVDISGIDHLIGVKELEIGNCPKFEVPSLLPLTELEVLLLRGQARLLVRAEDSIPHQLRELRWCVSRSSEGLNLNGCKQLEVLSLCGSDGLTSLAELGDLPALRHLDLGYCKHLLRLPDLSKSRNLEELNLDGCSALELHEKDIQMLFELRLLQPVPFSGRSEGGKFRLDLRRGKVLVHSSSSPSPFGEPWKAGEWEERDLGPPPIKIGRLGHLGVGSGRSR